MLNTLKLIYRNFRKNLSVNLINVGGLMLSMTVVIILSVYCYTELKTDTHHSKGNQTYLLTSLFEGSVDINTPGILYDYLKTDIPEIRKAIRVGNTWNPAVLKLENGEIFNTELIFSDQGFFQLFNYNTIRGNLSQVLSDPLSIALMKQEAERLFGTDDVIGKSIIVNNEYTTTIKAVIDQPIYNSFLKFDALLPMSSRHVIQPDKSEFTRWDNWAFQTFVQLDKHADPTSVGNKLSHLINEKSGDEELEPVSLLPIGKIYFSKINNSWLDYVTLGDKTKVIVLLIVAILILTIAIINFVNISSYSLQERLLQTGIFKLLGASSFKIFKNCVFESTLIFILSVWLAIMTAEIIKPVVGEFTGLDYSSNIILSSKFISISLLTAILLGILSSFWSGLRHSASNPMRNLKNKTNSNSKYSALKGSLVIFQFSAAIILISFTFLIHKQIQFGITGLGFEENNLISINLTTQLKQEILRNNLIQEPEIEKISMNGFFPNSDFSQWGADLDDNGIMKRVVFTTFEADEQFFGMMELELVKGRFFSDSLPSNRNKVVVNEAFMRKHGLDSLSNQTINDRFEIIGVIKDFHFKSKNQSIAPLAIMNRGYASRCLVQFKTENFSDIAAIHEKIVDICSELSQDFPVEISFMDNAIEKMYQSEVQFARTFTFFSMCAILISCLGILALTLFASQRRTKEIGIRKVNGAHTGDILKLLNKDFTKWVFIAFILAVPTGYFIMNKWLQQFAYKTEISWWIFVMGGLSALAIALLTVSWQSWKAARSNPVDALRYE